MYSFEMLKEKEPVQLISAKTDELMQFIEDGRTFKCISAFGQTIIYCYKRDRMGSHYSVFSKVPAPYWNNWYKTDILMNARKTAVELLLRRLERGDDVYVY